MPMLKTPITVLIMLLFFDSIRNSYMYLAWFEAACLAGISQKTGIECSRFPCDQNPHNFVGVWRLGVLSEPARGFSVIESDSTCSTDGWRATPL